ncbi:MAG: 50S ribosomal protein L21 [Alphaproteobacteria bacterium]
MFAIIRTGGKQYKVQKDDTIRVEKLEGKAGDTVNLGEVLFLSDGKSPKLGEPTIKGASVTAKLVEQTRGEKIIIFKKKRRQNYRRKNGHRQDITVLKITDIKAA